MKKKILATFAASMMIIISLAACSSSSNDAGSSVQDTSGSTAEVEETTAESNELVDHVELYDYMGTEPYSLDESINIAYWYIYFDEDCETNKYDYEDLIPVLAECVAQEENKQDGADKYAMTAYNSDSFVVFTWNQQENPYKITQTSWYSDDTHKVYEWVLTSEEVSEILGTEQ